MTLAERQAGSHLYKLQHLYWVFKRGVRAECTKGAEIVGPHHHASCLLHGTDVQLPVKGNKNVPLQSEK